MRNVLQGEGHSAEARAADRVTRLEGLGSQGASEAGAIDGDIELAEGFDGARRPAPVRRARR